jgi:hypothetical protein
MNIVTKYGTLRGCREVENAPDGEVKCCNFSEENRLETDCGILTPQYGPEDVRKKYIKALSFFPNGQIQRVALEKQTEIQSPIGDFPAELLTFYKGGEINRIFPLNGKISGFWTEQDEEQLAVPLHFSFYFGEFTAKIISIHFYQSGNIQSITLFPGEIIDLQTPVGKLKVRTGLSLYENGALQSVEPAAPSLISTKVGTLHAFDSNCIGISADRNSLRFDEKGNVVQMKSATDKIIIQTPNAQLETIIPMEKPDPLNDNATVTIPLKIEFQDTTVSLFDSEPHIYSLEDSAFTILQIPLISSCVDCSSCSQCQDGFCQSSTKNHSV